MQELLDSRKGTRCRTGCGVLTLGMHGITICWLVMTFVFATTPCWSEAPSLRVMSFNIRLGVADDGPNHWEKRRDLVVEAVRRFGPDLLGTQETYQFQADYLRESLDRYHYFGRSRMLDDNEHCGIFYDKTRFTWLAGGHFWLSQQPEVPQSKSWDSSLPRMATWVLLHDNVAGGAIEEASATEVEAAGERGDTDSGVAVPTHPARPILLINTHFDHRGSEARLRSAQLIRRRIQELSEIARDPLVIVTGDFNCPEASEPYQAFLAGNQLLIDTFRQLHPLASDSDGTFNGWTGTRDGDRIDWILTNPTVHVRSAEIDHWNLDGRYPSDHFPITAILDTSAAATTDSPPVGD